MRKFNLSTGEKVTVRPCMVDLDGTNLEEGLSITVNNTWSFEIMGYSENEITEDLVLEWLDDIENKM